MRPELERLRSTVLVVDLELTCWAGQPPRGQVQEVIEIGLCVLHTPSGGRQGRESILVKPMSQVSRFCTELTTLTPELLNRGLPFAEACEYLRAGYQSDRRAWASWGSFDRDVIREQCAAVGARYPFTGDHLDVQLLFSLVFGLTRRVGMLEALSLLELRRHGIHHRAVDDAWNIAAILSRLLLGRRRRRPGQRPEE